MAHWRGRPRPRSGGANVSPPSFTLLQRQLDLLLWPGCDLIGHDHTGTGIPVQERIVVFGRTKRFSFFVPAHRFAQEFVAVMSGAGIAPKQVCLGSTFADDAGVVGPPIRIA